MSKTNKLAACPRLDPLGVGKDISAADLVDRTFLAYNGGRLREAARLLAEKMLPNDGYIGMSLTGALTPAGHRRISLPAGQIRSGAQPPARLEGGERARHRLRLRHPDLHEQSGRFQHRHECRRDGVARLAAHVRREP